MHEEIAKADFASQLTKRIQNAVNVLGENSPFYSDLIDRYSFHVARIQVHKSSSWMIRLTMDTGDQWTISTKSTTFEQQFCAKRFIEYVFERPVVFRGDLQYSICNIDVHSSEPHRPWFDE